MPLTLGHITYINCAPFFHFLSEAGFRGRVLGGVPSHLNHLLSTGLVEVSPSSSFEYARNWRDYLLLPDQSISSIGPVKSVLLFSPAPMEELEGREIALTGESATSVNLLHVLLREFLGMESVVFRATEQPVEQVIKGGGAALLIGDRALKAALDPPAGCRIYDLGELWHRFTGLPFVFALWILRRDVASAKRKEVQELVAQLGLSRKRAMASLERLASEVPEKSWMGEGSLIDYWRCMSYDLTPMHLQGLELFFSLAKKHGLLDQKPEIRFFE